MPRAHFKYGWMEVVTMREFNAFSFNAGLPWRLGWQFQCWWACHTIQELCSPPSGGA